jgi:hypothetical protein
MQRTPKALDFVLCERMEVDPQEGQYSLVNVFYWLPWRAPGPLLKDFTLYGTLFDGRGNGLLQLEVSQMERERAAYRWSKPFASPGRGMSHILEIKVRGCVFPAPGRYSLSVRIDDKETGVFYLDVLRR